MSVLAGTVLLFELLAGRGREPLGPDTGAERRGYYMEDATLTEMGADGQPRIVVHARDIEQQVADESVVLNDLKLDYTTGKAGRWTVTAKHGRMPPDRTA